jgi:hypothetical protein
MFVAVKVLMSGANEAVRCMKATAASDHVRSADYAWLSAVYIVLPSQLGRGAGGTVHPSNNWKWVKAVNEPALWCEV